VKATVTKVEKRIIVKERRVEGILSYDTDNNYPNRVKDIVSNSGMGKACLLLYKKFIFGKGFEDQKLAVLPVNRWGDTANKVLSKCADNLAWYGGFAIHVNYNADYKITDISHISFATIRKASNESENAGMFAVHKDWGLKYVKKTDINFIDAFNPDPTVIQAQVERAGGWNSYKGQIFYYSGTDDQYPLTTYDAVLEDMQTDSQAKTYKFRNVTTSFMASHILFVDKMEADESETNGNERNLMVDGIKDFQGADDAQKIMIIERSHPDQKFELQKVDQQTGDKQFEWTENSTRDNIRQAFFIPSVLIMQTAGKLGTADEIIDATKYYNSITDDERLTLESSFTYISTFSDELSGYDFTIMEREAIRKEDIPQNLMQDLTVDERRALINYEPIEGGAEQTLAEKLQVGGTQSFISVISNPTLTNDQKRGTLKVLFNLSDEEINQVIPQEDVVNNTVANPAV